MNVKRDHHSCMVDQETSTIHVIGGSDQSSQSLSSTETWKINEDAWEMGSNLVEPVEESAAVSSKSNDFVGYLVGGFGMGGFKSKIWGLKRKNGVWIELSNVLQTPRDRHTLVNLRPNAIPGC